MIYHLLGFSASILDDYAFLITPRCAEKKRKSSLSIVLLGKTQFWLPGNGRRVLGEKTIDLGVGGGEKHRSKDMRTYLVYRVKMPLAAFRSMFDGRTVNSFTKFGCTILLGKIPGPWYYLMGERLVIERGRQGYLDF